MNCTRRSVLALPLLALMGCGPGSEGPVAEKPPEGGGTAEPAEKPDVPSGKKAPSGAGPS